MPSRPGPEIHERTVEAFGERGPQFVLGVEGAEVELFDGVFERLGAVALDQRLGSLVATVIEECTAECGGHGPAVERRAKKPGGRV
jgi:hypothetical protein